MYGGDHAGQLVGSSFCLTERLGPSRPIPDCQAAKHPVGQMAMRSHGLGHSQVASWPGGLMAKWPHGQMASGPDGFMGGRRLMARLPHDQVA